MSDSETANVPSDATISRALTDLVISIHKSGKTDDLTVKRVRARAEDELGLPSGFLKNEQWKHKSYDCIHEAVEKYCGDEPPPEPKVAPKPKSTPPKTKTTKKSTQGVKRKAAAQAKTKQKRRKTVASSDEVSDSALSNNQLSDADSEPPKKAIRRQKKILTEDSDDEDIPSAKIKSKQRETDEDENEEPEAAPAVKAPKPGQKHTLPAEVKGDLSESELSSLIDEPPVKKKRKTSAPDKRKSKEPKTGKPRSKASKPQTEDDPDLAEIKRLQGWLVKCGIRKIWGKELANCDTSKEKITHLRDLLKDAGMGGKFSNEKAARIKEQREFAKDLEEIQAGALAWGKAEDTVSGRPRRKLSRPAQKPVVPAQDSDEEKDSGQDGADASDEDENDDVKVSSEEDESDVDERHDSESTS